MRRRAWGGWLAAGIGGLCFLSSIGNDFTYDDLPIVRDNPRIRGLANTSEIWLSDWWAPQTAQQEVSHRHRDRLYRPLVMHTFALNYAVGGLVPAGYHVVNVLLHAVVCLLVWRLAQRLFGDAAISTCAALLFAVHPIHAEAVASVVGRAELLAALLLLSGLLVLLPVGRVPGRARAAGAAVLFLAALFSKETAVCYVPVALITLHAAAKKPERGVRWWWLVHTAVLLVPLVIYLPLRYVALDQHLLRDMPPDVLMNPLVWADLPHRWLHALTIVGHYARLLVVPVKLSCNYGLEIIDPERGPELLTLVGLLTVGAAIVALVGYRRPSVVWRRLAILTAMSIASYVLISNTVLVIGVSLAERLLYWPSVPMLLAIAVGVVHLWRHVTEQGKLSRDVARLVRVCGVLLLVALGLRSFGRTMDWSSNLALFGTDVRAYPQSAELNTAVANALLWRIHDSWGAGDTRPPLETARKHLEVAVRINPRSARAWQLQGRVLGMLGDRPGAIASFEEATRHGVLDHVSQMFLARLRDEAGEEAARAARLAEQVTTRPADPALRLEYGNLLLERGHYRQALEQLQEAVGLAPDSADALRLLGVVYIRLNEVDQAVAALEQAAAQDPSNWETHFYLAPLMAQRGESAACLWHAQEAFRLEPTRRETAQNLAEALAINNRIEQALALYRQIESSLSPNDPSRRTIQMRIGELERGLP